MSGLEERTVRTPSQLQKPSGWAGRFVLWLMNRRHSRLTDWGLQHVRIDRRHVILDVGCGGGRTVNKLVALASEGKVFGADYSPESVRAARRMNRRWIERGSVDIRQASVTELPFADDTFDLVTAIETHFWWPDLAGGVREIQRVLKRRGQLLIIAEFYDGGKHARFAKLLSRRTGIAALTIDQHREMFATAGFTEVQVTEDAERGWIAASGRKPELAR